MKTPPNKNNLMTETITHTMPSQPSIKKGKGEAGSTKVDSRMLILAAHFVSMLYAPFYLPVVAFMVLFIFSYLNLLPLQTKIVLTLIVYFSPSCYPTLPLSLSQAQWLDPTSNEQARTSFCALHTEHYQLWCFVIFAL